MSVEFLIVSFHLGFIYNQLHSTRNNHSLELRYYGVRTPQ